MIRGENVYHAKTPDGWVLAIKRYKPATDRAPYPVILFHGFAANRYCVDFGEEGSSEWNQYSLAGYLYRGGDKEDMKFDVWVPELRGRNGSRTFDPAVSPEKYNWCLDEYVDYDVPAIIKRVQREYRREGYGKVKIFWVGKSMGGMLAYAYGEMDGSKKEKNRNLKGVVTIASPAIFRNSKPILEHILSNFVLKVPCPNLINISKMMKRLIDDRRLSNEIVGFFASLKNMDEDILKKYLLEGFNSTIPKKVFKHFLIFLKYGDFCRYPRHPLLYNILYRFDTVRKWFAPYSYTKNLWKFKAPLCVIAGSSDPLAHPNDVFYAYYNVGTPKSRRKKILIPCYGHMNLNLGKDARKDVYPKIYNWLKKEALRT